MPTLGTAPVVLYRPVEPGPGDASVVGVADGWIVAAGVERLALAGGGTAATGPGGRIMPVAELAIPGAHNVSNALAAIAVGLLFGVPHDAIRCSGRELRGRRTSPRAGRTRRRGQVRQRFPGHPARRGRRRPAFVRPAARAHRRRTRQGRRPVGPAAGRCRARGRGSPHRRERPDPRAPVPRGRARPHRARREPRRGGEGGRLDRPGVAGRGCGRPGDGAAQPGCGELRHVRRLRGPRPRVQGCRRGPGCRADQRARPDDEHRGPRHQATDANQPAARPARARPRDPRLGHVAGCDRDPDGLLVVGHEGLPQGRRHVRDRRAADLLGGSRDAGHARDHAARLPLSPARLVADIRDRDRAPGARLRAEPEHRHRRLGPLAQDRAAAGHAPGRVREARPASSISRIGPPSAVRRSAASGQGRCRSW